jgi:hypothetical protein
LGKNNNIELATKMHPRKVLKRKSDYTDETAVNSVLPAEIQAKLHQNNGFVSVPLDQLLINLHAYDRVLDIRNATTIAKKMMFSGGIQFGRVGFFIEDRDTNQLSTKWKQWAVAMWRYLDCANFAAATFDPVNPEPLVLPLELLDIQIKKDSFGKLIFKYYKVSTQDANAEAKRYEIPNVHTFYFDNNILDAAGNLVSIVSAILLETNLYHFKKQMTMIADYSRAMPCLVTESIPERNDSDLLPYLPQTAELHGNGFAPHAASTTDIAISKIGTGGGQHYLSRIPNGHAPTFPGERKLGKTPEHENYATAIDLPEGRKLVAGPIPEAPTDLLNISTSDMEKIYLSWGIPLSMISNSASSGAMRNNTGQKGKGGASSGSNGSSARMIFQAYQQDMKSFTIAMIETMYNLIYLHQHYKQVKNKYAKQNTKIDSKNVKDYIPEMIVTVSIPGLPADDILQMLLTMGALKYDYYKKVTAARWSIPLEAFNDKLELTVQELNGIVEKEAATKPAAKKKAKK